LTWTRIADPDEAASLLPAWFGIRMIGLRGRFGLVLTTGDILRITSIVALHQSPTGIVLLDHGGVPDGIDLTWHPCPITIEHGLDEHPIVRCGNPHPAFASPATGA
jgi:hypothetical protein